MQGPTERMSDTERAERALAICVVLDLGAPLFAALENDLEIRALARADRHRRAERR